MNIDPAMIWIALGITLAAMGGFMCGFILADNRRKTDDTFNPKHRPERFFKTRPFRRYGELL